MLRELFEKTSQSYRDTVLPVDNTPRIVVEAGVPMGWERYCGENGAIIGLSHFGASAPGGTVFEKFGFTAERVVEKALALTK